MADDMDIHRYTDEPDDSYIYRVCYSALGRWCLQTAQNRSGDIQGTTKHNQTIIINELIFRFSELFPEIEELVSETNNTSTNIAVHVRRVYEETGYLLTCDENRNTIANHGRSHIIANEALFFGIPRGKYAVNGLGMYSSPTIFQITQEELLIRDDLTWEEYFNSRFDEMDFFGREIDVAQLEYFDPLSDKVPSQSWTSSMNVNFTVARKGLQGPYYRVALFDDSVLQYADEPVESNKDAFTSCEYRRLYFALKAHYKKPLKVHITGLDSYYSKITLDGHLPNREYYYLLLLSWPVHNAFDKVNFLVKTSFVPSISLMLTSLGIEVHGGDGYEKN